MNQLTMFLKRQNRILKQQNKQLKTVLNLNRQALKLSTSQFLEQKTYSKLIQLLFDENTKLHKKVSQISQQLQTGMCQALISQQIAYASTQQQKYLTNQLKDKLIKSRKQLQIKQKRIIQLMKNTDDKKNNGDNFRIVQFTEINTVVKKLKDQNMVVINQLEYKDQEISKFKDQKEELIKLNLILTKQINQYKYNQSNSTKDVDGGSGSGGGGGYTDLSKFMSYQKRIIEDDDDNQSDYEGQQDQDSSSSSGVDDVVEEPSKISKLKLDMSRLPKLQLTKAKEIQDLIVQKINNQDNKKKNIGGIKEERVRKVQAELAIARKKISTSMMEKLAIQRQNAVLRKIVKEIESRNQLLVQSTKHSQSNSNQIRYYENIDASGNDNGNFNGRTETLLGICKDVTLNPVLRKVIYEGLQLAYNPMLQSYDC